MKLIAPTFLAVWLISIGVHIAHADSGVSNGTGFIVSAKGEILTNAHVVTGCSTVTVRLPDMQPERASVVARDPKNDLALLKGKSTPTAVAVFRQGPSVRTGDSVVVLGYPLSSLLGTEVHLTVGVVNALAGLADDSRYLQISSPIQLGNSGSPLLDDSGHIVGVVTAKLDAATVAKSTGDIPQNVNFAIKSEIAELFLMRNKIAIRSAPVEHKMSPADIGDIARPFTVSVQCALTSKAYDVSGLDAEDASYVVKAREMAEGAPIGRRIRWLNPRTRNSGTVTVIREETTNSDSTRCRYFKQTLTVDGKTSTSFQRVCFAAEDGASRHGL